jgi:multifunctional methyltransferase subunit TRM112
MQGPPPPLPTPSTLSTLSVQITVAEGGIKQEESEFNPAFVAHLLPKLSWPALRETAAALGIAELPEALPPAPTEDEAFLKSVHDLVMDIHITEGALTCPNCARA